MSVSTLPARQQEVLQILREELPSTRQIAGSQRARGDPILDRADAHTEYLCEIASAVEGLKRPVLDRENPLQHRKAS